MLNSQTKEQLLQERITHRLKLVSKLKDSNRINLFATSPPTEQDNPVEGHRKERVAHLGGGGGSAIKLEKFGIVLVLGRQGGGRRTSHAE